MSHLFAKEDRHSVPDKSSLPINFLKSVVSDRQLTGRFSVNRNLEVIRKDQTAADALKAFDSCPFPIDACLGVKSTQLERTKATISEMLNEANTRVRFLRIDMGDGLSSRPYCLTLSVANGKSPNPICNCLLEPISSAGLREPPGFEQPTGLESSGIIVWSFDLKERNFDLNVDLGNLIEGKPTVRHISIEDWIECIHWNDRDAFKFEFDQFLKGSKENFHARYNIISGPEETKLISTIARRRGDPTSGQPPKLIGFHKDENALTNMKGELRLFSFLAKKIHSPIVITDAHDHITWVNNAFTQMSGHELEEIAGMRPSDLLQGESSSISESEKIRVRIAKRKAYHAETVHYRKNGQPYWVMIDANPLIDENGRLTHYISFQTDITESRKTQSAIQRNEIKFRALFDNSIEPLLLASSKDHIIIEANKATANLTGDNALIGKRLEQLIDANYAIDIDKLNTAIANEKPYNLHHIEIIAANGEKLNTDLSITSIPIGESIGLLVNLKDISEVSFLEEQLRQSQRIEAVGKLAGGIAHDFNNLLLGIRGFSELLANSPTLSRRDLSYVDQLVKTTERASNLTSRLLSFSRRKKRAAVITNINEIVESIYPMLSRLLKTEISFTTSLEADLPNIKVDTGQIEQIIMNLVVNAEEATKGKCRSIELSTFSLSMTGNELLSTGKPNPGKYVCLKVKDNGHGMDSELLEKIFEPFFTTKEDAGTGLGLSIVYGIIESNDSQVDVQSEIGKGTSFTLYLPAAQGSVDEKKDEKVSNPEPPMLKKGVATILIAEDQVQVREILSLGLEARGHNLLVAEDGLQAYELAKSCDSNIDLVITDSIMPRMSGVELARSIKNDYPDTKIVLMSGLPKSEAVSDEDLIYLDEFVPKPFSIRELVTIANNLLAEKES